MRYRSPFHCTPLTRRTGTIFQSFNVGTGSNGSGLGESNAHSAEAVTHSESSKSNSWQNGGKKIPLFL